MTPEQLQELKEKAELWDSLSDSLKGIYASQFKYGTSTIENISNSSSHIGLLVEESKEMVENKCSCGSDGRKSHTCPFKEEINNSFSECNCCKMCTHECAMDI